MDLELINSKLPRGVAFCIPTTSRNRDEWSSAEDTYLWQILCKYLDLHIPPHDIKLFVGYDEEDRIFSIAEERLKFKAVFSKFRIEWFPFDDRYKGKPTWIWNSLGEKALEQNYEYIKLLGDDIRLPNDTGWLGCMINKLKKNRNIGWSAGYSNNDAIATQFLVHKTHYDIFKFFYPPQIEAWYCDDFLNLIYPQKYKNWLRSFPLLNVGGVPRYQPKDDKRLCEALVRRYKPTLNRFLQQINK